MRTPPPPPHTHPPPTHTHKRYSVCLSWTSTTMVFFKFLYSSVKLHIPPPPPPRLHTHTRLTYSPPPLSTNRSHTPPPPHLHAPLKYPPPTHTHTHSPTLVWREEKEHSLNLPLEEVDADGLLVVLGEDALAVALDHGGLANGAVSHHHHLDRHLHLLLTHLPHPRNHVQSARAAWNTGRTPTLGPASCSLSRKLVCRLSSVTLLAWPPPLPTGHCWPGHLLYPLATAGLATSFTHWPLLTWPPPLPTGHCWPGHLLCSLVTAGLATSFTHWPLLAWPPPLLTGHCWYAGFPLAPGFTLLFSFYSN